ncbi:snRNA-activating protein complex subunit 4 [Phyllobates terribilis]|uniref:snRNA-activating protein complex subunit 4 n=1 Tax=Phyllobates terribilis TaxID=111132 RepID=UPI003CCB1135
MSVLGDLNAARDQIQREIEALERTLGPDVSSIDVIVSGSSSSDESGDDYSDTLDEDFEADELVLEDGGHRAEMCLQMNLVYQAVIQEKLQEVQLLISQNKVQQEELLWELAGRKTQRVGSTKPYPANLSIGHFYKPYFKDKVTGVGPPANLEMMARSSHIVKAFKELTSSKWRPSDPDELRKAVLSDSLQKILQPKLSKLEYLQQKRDAAKCEADKKLITKQIQEVEQQISAVNQLPEETLLGQRTDDHDWEKISNVNFEGVHNADRISKMWKNNLHPHINKENWREEEIKKLQEIAQEHNFVNWEVIAEELGTKRTAFQCLQQFQLNKKDFKRKEFVKEEDEVLTHLVQRMRVGMHIPYHKIAYFMEGRNSMQLFHRWSKCLDPSLKKGYWNREEDKLLLKAVEKYGAKDWYKIQLEVPGRSDIQCRERYVKGLHKDVKKGHWSEEEKQKLIELTEKYGVGHWSKVSRELHTHRTGGQCLSKWKNLTGYFKRLKLKREQNGMAPKRRAPRKRPRKKTQERLQSTVQQERPQYTAPEQRPQYTAPEQRPQSTAFKIKEEELSDDDISDLSSDSISSYISSSNSSTSSSSNISSSGGSTSTSSSSEDEDDLDYMSDIEERIAATRFLESMPDLDLWVPRKENPDLLPKKASPHSATSSCCKIPRSTMRGKRGKFQFSTILKGIAYPPSTDIVTENPEDILLEAKKSGHYILQVSEDDVRRILRWNTILCQGKQAQQTKPEDDTSEKLPLRSKRRKKSPPVDRSLLITVTPWVGNVFLPIQVRYKSPWENQIHADVMTKKLSALTITSTPIFTLLIQFFQINTLGCLQMIQLRKARASQNRKRTSQQTRAVSSSLKRIYGSISNARLSQPSNVEPGPQAKHQRPPREPAPAPKPKTVFELLKEKRQKESKARRAAAQKTVVVAPSILISSQIVVSQTPITAGQPENPALPVASSTSQNSLLQTIPFVALPTCQGIPSSCIASDQLSPASSGQQRADADQAVTPAPDAEATDKCNSTPSATCTMQHSPVMASPQLPLQQLLSALSPLGNSTTWILTPQGLIQIPVQTLFPTATQAPRNQDPGNVKAVNPSTNEASNVVPEVQASTSSTVVHPPVPERNGSSPSENTEDGAAPCASPAPSPSNKSTQVTLTPTKKYPVVKIAKILPPNQPNEDTSNREKTETPAPAHTRAQTFTSSAERNFGDLSLISLEDETSVKDWMKGKSSGGTLKSSMAYLPPSACTLKTFSRILLQKTNLEERAFKLVPPDGAGEGDTSKKQEILDDLVEQKLKNNPAYNLLKKRFLSAFTFTGLLAVFPAPNSERIKPGVKSEVKEEDHIMDINMYDKNTDVCTGGESPRATTGLHLHEGEMMDPGNHCSPMTTDCESEADTIGMRLRSKKVYSRSET